MIIGGEISNENTKIYSLVLALLEVILSDGP